MLLTVIQHQAANLSSILNTITREPTKIACIVSDMLDKTSSTKITYKQLHKANQYSKIVTIISIIIGPDNHLGFLNNPQLKTRENIQELIRSSLQNIK